MENEEHGWVIGRSYTALLAQMCRPRIQFPSSDGCVGTRRATIKDRPSVLGFGSFRATCAPRRFLATTTTSDHGCKKFQRMETSESGERYIRAECHHRGHEPCQRSLECGTNQGRIWLCQCYFDNDQGTFSPILRWYIQGSRGIRNQWLMSPTASTSG